MRIFINSCGYSRQDPAHEYRWKSLTGDFPGDALEELSRKRFHGISLNDLIESDSRQPSVVFARDGQDVILFLTRLRSAVRAGSQGDPIFASALFVGKAHHFTVLRRTAANVIASVPPQENDFSLGSSAAQPSSVIGEILDRAVSFHEANGYAFDPDCDLFEELDVRLDAIYGLNPLQREGFRWRPKMGHNCYKLRQELAYELTQFSVPLGPGPLAVVTGVKLPYFAKKAEAWRSLSALNEGVNWQPLPVAWRTLRRRDRDEASLGGWARPASRIPGLAALSEALGWAQDKEESVEKL
jgi:hypothetical protein